MNNGQKLVYQLLELILTISFWDFYYLNQTANKHILHKPNKLNGCGGLYPYYLY